AELFGQLGPVVAYLFLVFHGHSLGNLPWAIRDPGIVAKMARVRCAGGEPGKAKFRFPGPINLRPGPTPGAGVESRGPRASSSFSFSFSFLLLLLLRRPELPGTGGLAAIFSLFGAGAGG